ncbi:MAG: 2-C-methyl-D-erythritol 4-phosphate cytidylyltransferase [Thermoleophilia bacterium]
MHLGVVIAAGGVGSRMGTGESKQLMMLAGQPVLARSAAIFEAAPEVEEIVIVIDAPDTRRCRAEVVEPYGLGKVRNIVPGGENRAASVLNGLQRLSGDVDTVLIHDGARPLFPSELLASGLRDLAIGDCDGVVFALPLTDTVKEVGIGTRLITRTPDRSRLWAAQTPQIFKRAKLDKAYRVRPSVLEEATDDSFLVERMGGWMKITPGSPENIKITTPEDIVIAEEILRRRENKEETR